MMFAQAEFIPRIPLGDWIEGAVEFITEAFAGVFGVIEFVVNLLVESLTFVMTAPPALVMIALFGLLAFFLSGWRTALFTVVGLVFMISINLWEAAMVTLALVLVAAIVALAVGIPIGILAAQYRSVEAPVRPILDFMQTMPAFVYLVPAILIFGLGGVPAVLATVVFAMPPAVRLTLLGIQQVPGDTVEAARAFGATPWQTLVKVELPQAFKTIMAGVNQVIMLAFSMVVIAALIGAGGLGIEVVSGLSQLDVGRGFTGGIGIVVMAIILDRITRSIGHSGASPTVKGG